MRTSSYLIIGTGVFGASTAYHLAKKYPGASIMLIDRTEYPCNLGASWDWNKVIRADYGDIFYMEKGLEAIELWKNDPLYKPFFHQVGVVKICKVAPAQEMIDDHKKLKSEVAPYMVSIEEFKKMYGGFCEDADYSDVEAALIDAAVSLGVKYVEGEVSTLTFDGAGDCTGVLLTDGKTLTSENVIMSTGALTAKLLADSAPTRTEMQVGNRIVAVCVVTGVVKLAAEEWKKYTEIPVTIHFAPCVRGEIMPLTPPIDANEPYTV